MGTSILVGNIRIFNMILKNETCWFYRRKNYGCHGYKLHQHHHLKTGTYARWSGSRRGFMSRRKRGTKGSLSNVRAQNLESQIKSFSPNKYTVRSNLYIIIYVVCFCIIQMYVRAVPFPQERPGIQCILMCVHVLLLGFLSGILCGSALPVLYFLNRIASWKTSRFASAQDVEIFVSETGVTFPTETAPNHSGAPTPGDDEDLWIWESPVWVGHVDMYQRHQTQIHGRKVGLASVK